MDFNDLTSLRTRAKALVEAKQYEEALRLYKESLVRVAPCSTDILSIIHANISLCLLELSRAKEAEEEARKAIQLNSKYAKAHYRRVSALLALGHIDEAAEAADRASNLLPDDEALRAQAKKVKEVKGCGRFVAWSDPSWMKQLNVDPTAAANAPNKASREVKSGHYVPVLPTPLPSPVLVAFTPDLAEELGFSREFCKSPSFLGFFSGHMESIPLNHPGWATGYALSIYGQEMTSNCPFGTGNGYGDGRAISVAEVVSGESGRRLELQLKGAGGTPYRRRGDGRATVRSSVREFLASEAMHNFGISTTRALSLVASLSEHVDRPSFSGDGGMTRDFAAIGCRVAASFMRVGHIELFARRYRRTRSPQARDELRMIVEHAMFREFGGPPAAPANSPDRPGFQEQILDMLRQSARRIQQLTADWIRVGFCQGNFNSDNCLVGGRTMDYGPFGFMERYQRSWNMWKDSGEHFSFRNQPIAGEHNFFSLAKSVALLLNEESLSEAQSILQHYSDNAEAAVMDIYRQKMGLQMMTPVAVDVFKAIDELMEKNEADYTLFWRQLSKLPESILPAVQVTLTSQISEKVFANISNETILASLSEVFYKPLSSSKQSSWANCLKSWLSLLLSEIVNDFKSSSSLSYSDSESKDGSISDALKQFVFSRSLEVSAAMRKVSPKYVPREWILAEAYQAAERGNYGPVLRLQELFRNPYEEQPEMESLFYRRAPAEVLGKNGISCMT